MLLQVLLRCPVCKWAMRGSNLYRHISIKHPEVDIGKIEPERVEPKRAKEKLPIINCTTLGPVVIVMGVSSKPQSCISDGSIELKGAFRTDITLLEKKNMDLLMTWRHFIFL